MTKILHVSTSDLRFGGFIAAHRLHTGMRQLGEESQMLVQFKGSDDPHVVAAESSTRAGREIARVTAVLDRVPLALYKNGAPMDFSPHWLPARRPSELGSMRPDIVNLHWISGGFVSIEALPRFPKPLVWTLHDMWPFTGGCHYSHGCTAYESSCGTCPELQSRSRHDLSWFTSQRKARAWRNLELTLVAPSSWAAACAQSSKLFGRYATHVIPNGLDLRKFAPIDKGLARRLLRLPEDRDVILFGAPMVGDQRKGFDLLEAALLELKRTEWSAKVLVVIFGTARGAGPERFGLDTRYLGRLHDDVALAAAYSAADVMVVPSREETFGQTASEALACGTPVVCFDCTGLRDVVDHLETGYRARSFDAQDLARGLVWVLEDGQRRQELASRARARAEEAFDVENQARAYLKVYDEALGRARQRAVPSP